MTQPVIVTIPANTPTQILSEIELGVSKQLRIWYDGGPVYLAGDNTVSQETGYPPLSTEVLFELRDDLGTGTVPYSLWAYFDPYDPVETPEIRIRIWNL